MGEQEVVGWKCSRCHATVASLPETSKTVDPRFRLAECKNEFCPSRQERKHNRLVAFAALYPKDDSPSS